MPRALAGVSAEQWFLTVFWAIALIGCALRFYGLGRIPAGLNGDEAEEGVEAISLLATSMDRWGDPFPVFFPHVGSGMQPLYTYLTLPVFAVFGPSAWSLRFMSAALGMLTLFTTYFIGKASYGRSVGLLSMGFVAFLPWHMMESRWGIDWSILPFWFSAGVLTMTMALKPGAHPWWKLAAFAPWAISIYAYFATTIPITVISLAIVYCFRKSILADWRWWAAGLAAALVIDIPILLFACVNYLNIGFPLRLKLPFSIPVLPVSRFAQIDEPFVPKLIKNLTFLISGYRDTLVWNQSGYFLPLTAAAPVLTLISVIAASATALKTRRPNLLLVILLGAVVPILAVRLNVNRFNWFYIPSIVVCAAFLVDVTKHIDNNSLRSSWIIGLSAYLVLFLSLFYAHYFTQYNVEILSEDVTLGNGFRVGLEDALHTAAGKAGAAETIYVDAGDAHPYVYVLFYRLASTVSFQKTRRLRPADDRLYHVTGFDRFVFEREAIPQDASYVFVTLPDRLPCAAPEVFTHGPLWAVGRCAPAGKAG